MKRKWVGPWRRMGSWWVRPYLASIGWRKTCGCPEMVYLFVGQGDDADAERNET